MELSKSYIVNVKYRKKRYARKMETFKKATIKVIVNICPTEGDIWFALPRHVQ